MTHTRSSPTGWRAALRRRRRPVLALGTAVLAAVATTAVVQAVDRGLARVGDAPAPFAWSVRTPAVGACVQNAVTGHDVRRTRPPDRLADFPAWAARVGARPNANTMLVTITLQGTYGDAIVLQDVRVRVLRTALPAKDVFSVGGFCGGEVTPRLFDVTLDRPSPALRAEPGIAEAPTRHGELTLPAMDLPYRLSPTGPEVFAVRASAGTADAAWVIELEWTSGRRGGTIRIDDRGRPFHTVSTAARPAYAYDGAARKWSLLG